MNQARVLIVERDPAADDRYARALAAAGPLELVFCREPAAALQALGEQSFDLLIATIASPDSDGLDLLAKARAIDSHLPVILVDRQPALEKATRGLRLGAGDYLAADAIAADLAASAERLLGARRHRCRVRSAAPAGRAAVQFRRHRRRLPGNAQSVRD